MLGELYGRVGELNLAGAFIRLSVCCEKIFVGAKQVVKKF